MAKTPKAEIVTVACLQTNYAYLVRSGGRTAVVDVPEARPILNALAERGWAADEVWLTHHHGDHVDGLAELKASFPDTTVIGAEADKDRLPKLDRTVSDGDSFDFSGQTVHVMDASGHTVGHIAFHMPQSGAAFTGDCLMAFGCGKLFEGTPRMMWDSLSRIAALPDETLAYSGHEITLGNARFALTIEPDNPDVQTRAQSVEAAREAGRFTVPASIAEEKATNPFLRANLPQVKAAVGMPDATDAEVFAEIRARKDAG